MEYVSPEQKKKELAKKEKQQVTPTKSQEKRLDAQKEETVEEKKMAHEDKLSMKTCNYCKASQPADREQCSACGTING